jgi:hypothetical protein
LCDITEDIFGGLTDYEVFSYGMFHCSLLISFSLHFSSFSLLITHLILTLHSLSLYVKKTIECVCSLALTLSLLSPLSFSRSLVSRSSFLVFPFSRFPVFSFSRFLVFSFSRFPVFSVSRFLVFSFSLTLSLSHIHTHTLTITLSHSHLPLTLPLLHSHSHTSTYILTLPHSHSHIDKSASVDSVATVDVTASMDVNVDVNGCLQFFFNPCCETMGLRITLDDPVVLSATASISV